MKSKRRGGIPRRRRVTHNGRYDYETAIRAVETIRCTPGWKAESTGMFGRCESCLREARIVALER